MAKKDPVGKLLEQHKQLTHSEHMKVKSHVQRNEDDWVLHTLMIVGIDVPFVFKRKKKYKNLVGASVNLTYYPHTKLIAGIEFETMKVVRIKVS